MGAGDVGAVAENVVCDRDVILIVGFWRLVVRGRLGCCCCGIVIAGVGVGRVLVVEESMGQFA
jgi:hypothetical protein